MKNKIFFYLMISIVCFTLGGVSFFWIGNYFSENENSEEQAIDDYSNVKFRSGEYHNKIWTEDNNQNALDMEYVPDMESATQIATVIFNNKQKQGLYKDYKLQSVFYDEVDKVWVIGFWPSSDEMLYVGADFNIAISQKTGEILKTWVGE